MELAQLDEILRRFGEIEQQVANNLIELEARPTFGLLRTSTWRGRSADEFRPAVAAMGALWRSFRSFGELLANARTRRGTARRLDDVERQSLEVLLTGASVLVDVAQLPAEQRTLLGPTVRETWVTPEQLIAQMSADYDLVGDAVGLLDAAWRDLVPALDRARAALTTAEVEADDPALATVREQLSAIEAALGDDPLGLAPSTVAQLDAAVSIVRERGARAAGAAAALVEVRGRAEARVTEVRRLLAEVRAARRAREAKIGGPAVPSAPAPDSSELDALVAELAAGSERSDVHALARVEGVLTRLDALHARASASVAVESAPLARRDELRGLLHAYQAKAGASGMLEDERVSSIVRAAEQELYRAPTDLERAAHLVDELGTALRGRKGTP